MRIIITLEDTENGQVRVKTNPDFETLAKIARSRDITPACGFAFGALTKIQNDAKKQTQENAQSQYDAGKIPMFESDRRMFS